MILGFVDRRGLTAEIEDHAGPDGLKKTTTIALVGREEYLVLASTIGSDVVLSKKILAANEILVTADAAAQELGAVLARLVETEGPGRRRAALLAKAREQELDPAEKEELRVLLGRRSGGAGGQREAG